MALLGWWYKVRRDRRKKAEKRSEARAQLGRDVKLSWDQASGELEIRNSSPDYIYDAEICVYPPSDPTNLQRPCGWGRKDLGVTVRSGKFVLGNIPSEPDRGSRVRRRIGVPDGPHVKDEATYCIYWHPRPSPYVPDGLTFELALTLATGFSRLQIERRPDGPARAWYEFIAQSLKNEALRGSARFVQESVGDVVLRFATSDGQQWSKRVDTGLTLRGRTPSPTVSIRRAGDTPPRALQWRWIVEDASCALRNVSSGWLRKVVVRGIPKLVVPLAVGACGWTADDVEFIVALKDIELFDLPPSDPDEIAVEVWPTLSWRPKPSPFVPSRFDRASFISLTSSQFGYRGDDWVAAQPLRALYEDVLWMEQRPRIEDLARQNRILTPADLAAVLLADVVVSFTDSQGRRWRQHRDGSIEPECTGEPKGVGVRSVSRSLIPRRREVVDRLHTQRRRIDEEHGLPPA